MVQYEVKTEKGQQYEIESIFNADKKLSKVISTQL